MIYVLPAITKNHVFLYYLSFSWKISLKTLDPSTIYTHHKVQLFEFGEILIKHLNNEQNSKKTL